MGRRHRFRSVLDRLHRKRRVHVIVLTERGTPRSGQYGKNGVIIDEQQADDGARVWTIRIEPDDYLTPPEDDRRGRRTRIVREVVEDELPSSNGINGAIAPKDDLRAATERRILWVLALLFVVVVLGNSITVWMNFEPGTLRDYYRGLIVPLFQLALPVLTLYFHRRR